MNRRASSQCPTTFPLPRHPGRRRDRQHVQYYGDFDQEFTGDRDLEQGAGTQPRAQELRHLAGGQRLEVQEELTGCPAGLRTACRRPSSFVDLTEVHDDLAGLGLLGGEPLVGHAEQLVGDGWSFGSW